MKIILHVKTISGSEFHKACKQAEPALAVQVLKDTRPFVPALTGVFSNLARVDKNEVVYTGDQVRYLYEGKVMVDAVTGKGPMNIPDVGIRWHKGATLRPTDRDLVFTTDMHPNAQSHWMEASYEKNAENWAADGEKAVMYYLGR